MAFQGAAVPVSSLASYNERAMTAPDITIFIDTPPEECTRRILSARQYLEIYDGEKLAREIRGRYLELFGLFNDSMPVVTIDGSLSEQEVFARLLDALRLYVKIF
jgi:thymidylate kinase